MTTRRWFDLLVVFLVALAATLGGLVIGYVAGRSAEPERRFTVGSCTEGRDTYLYRYDVQTGKTWRTHMAYTRSNHAWKEFPEPVDWDDVSTVAFEE
jgi:hypothetical protein